MRNRKKIVVVGSGFAGLTAALELKQRVQDRHDVVVIAKSDRFLFSPSLIWIPFGLQAGEDIAFPVRPRLEEAGVEFRHDEVIRLDLVGRAVITRSGLLPYDYLVIATGARPNYAAIPGLGPSRYTQSIMSLPEAERARIAFERFQVDPGPVIVGSVQDASCLTAAYEFLFAMACELRRLGLAGKASLTYLTAEPCLARSTSNGPDPAGEVTEEFARHLDVRAVTGASVRQITRTDVHLADGQVLPFAYAMLVPSFLGVQVVRACDRITSPSGFVRVNDFCHTEPYPEVFAAGSAVTARHPDSARSLVAEPTVGTGSERMARVVAHNIAARLSDEPMLAIGGDAPTPRVGAMVDPDWKTNPGMAGYPPAGPILLSSRAP